MPSAVLDTTVLVSAFLKPVPGGASFELLRFAEQGEFDLYLSDDILDETTRVLRTSERNRRRYKYPDEAIVLFCRSLGRFAMLVSDPPQLTVVRDPNDDMVVACAVKAGADYIVSRDHDLRVLESYQGIRIITPEAFLHVLRDRGSRT